MKPFEKFITESIVDIPQSNLDHTVFEFPDEGEPPHLRASIKKQILNDIQQFNEFVQIKRVYLVGSILTKLYTENSDIDVNIDIYKEEVDDLLQSKLLMMISKLNGRLAIGTTHPINYYIILGDVNEENFDAMYDVYNDKWLKVPTNIDYNVSQYLNNFQKIVSKIDLTLAQLRRDIIDYETLSKFTPEEVHNLQILLQRKMFEISEKTEVLIDIKNAIHKNRKRAYLRPMTPEEIQHYKKKNYLPENVIEKLLQKYYYWDFIKKLEKIMDKKDVLDTSDIEKIKRLDKAACIKTFEGYVNNEKAFLLQEKIKKIRLKRIDWNDPVARSKSFMQKYDRSMNRQNLTQVPAYRRVDPRNITQSNLGSAKKIVDNAKHAPSGIWRLTPSQVQWLAVKYHHIPPNDKSPIKHLGNTGIMVWRKNKGMYYLVKQGRHILAHQ